MEVRRNWPSESLYIYQTFYWLLFYYSFFTGASVIVWKQTDRIISAGEVLLRKDARMSLIKTPNGINLQIANVTPDDRGKSILFPIPWTPLHLTFIVDADGKITMCGAQMGGEMAAGGDS